MYQYHAPLDPECPDVKLYYDAHENDPISQMCGCLDEIFGSFESSHRSKCKRCQNYGAANIEVVD